MIVTYLLIGTVCFLVGFLCGHLSNKTEDAEAPANVNEKPVERKQFVSAYNRKKIEKRSNVSMPSGEGFLNEKKIVVTGVFEKWPDRQELVDLLCSKGARVMSGVTEHIDYLIVGDYEAGPKKYSKAKDMQEKGGKIQIIHAKELDNFFNGAL